MVIIHILSRIAPIMQPADQDANLNHTNSGLRRKLLECCKGELGGG